MESSTTGIPARQSGAALPAGAGAQDPGVVQTEHGPEPGVGGDVVHDEAAPEAGSDAVPSRSVDEIERLLNDVESALSRLDDRTYGMCTSCGSVVDDARLSVSPATVLCARCEAAGSPDPAIDGEG